MTSTYRVATGSLLALLVAMSLTVGATAQSPDPDAELTDPKGAPPGDVFPSAVEISGIMGVEVELLGVEGGLSQAWEGSDFTPDSVRSAEMAIYMSPGDEGSRHAVLIDIVRFASAADALEQTREFVFDETTLPGAFETGLAADLIATMSFTRDGTGFVFIQLVTGPDAFSATALVEGGPAPEVQGEAIAELILERLAHEPPAASGSS